MYLQKHTKLVLNIKNKHMNRREYYEQENEQETKEQRIFPS